MKSVFRLFPFLIATLCVAPSCSDSSTLGESSDVTAEAGSPPYDTVEGRDRLSDAGGESAPEDVASNADDVADEVDDAAGPADVATPPADTALPETEEPGQDEHFSFFVTSLEAMQELSGSLDGFGGNLGGLEGADDICQTIAATVEGGDKVWRAFLSATSGDDGQPVHAIERIGEGPWYDRNGRLVAMNKEDLIAERPIGADPQIIDDLPNEFGQGQKQFGDNHDTLTGTNASGMLHSADPLSTCMDWKCPGNALCPESVTFEKKVMGGHSWPREDNGGGGGGPGGGGLSDQQSAACAGLQGGDACSVSLGPGQINSSCATDEATGELLCSVPVPPPWFFACANANEGDSCNVDKGPEKFDGTCGQFDDVSSLACLPEGFDPTAIAGGGSQDATNWMSAHTVPGCDAGIELEQTGGGQGTLTVGGAGGYGGLYCFALTP